MDWSSDSWRAKCQLLDGKHSVEQIAAGVSFTNLSHFRRIFKRYYGGPRSALRDARRS